MTKHPCVSARRRLPAAMLAITLVACAPQNPTGPEAEAAMEERMERPAGDRKVEVEKIHALVLSGCAKAATATGVVCQVDMDVSFSVDGEEQRSKDSDRMRFVREDGRWQAYPADKS